MPDLLEAGAHDGAVLVVAHGNSIRALRKHIDGISDAEIVALEVPTGIPFRYRLADDLSVTDAGYLGDPEAARTAAQAVARPRPAEPAGPQPLTKRCATSRPPPPSVRNGPGACRSPP